MKKNYFLLMLAIGMCFTSKISAQSVSGMPTGYISTTPTISTAANPVWYNMMASNTDVARVNRYMYYDGTNLKTDLFNAPGITDALQHDKYMWRLEQGSIDASHVVLVNKLTGKKLWIANTCLSNDPVSMADTGVEWKMAASTASGSVLGQYSFNYDVTSALRYLNAGDGVTKAWAMLVFDGAGSPAKSSGWFFYPVTSQKTVSFAPSTNGTIALTATNGTATATALTTGSSVLVGTVVTVNITPANGYMLSTLTVNGADVTSSVTTNSYSFPVNADATVAATFTIATATINPSQNSAVYISAGNLYIGNRMPNTLTQIFDLCGKQLIRSTASSISTTTLPKGVYVLKYETSSGPASTKISK